MGWVDLCSVVRYPFIDDNNKKLYLRVHLFMQYRKSMRVNKEENDEIILSIKILQRRAPPLNKGMTSLGWAPH